MDLPACSYLSKLKGGGLSGAVTLGVLAASLYYVGIFLFMAWYRIPYPYELEWMEGGAVDHVRRILSGNQLYGRPTLHFTPFIYPPLYYYVSAIASELMGVGFLPLRVISSLASLGCFAIIFLFVKRETGSYSCGTLAMCLYAATFRISGAWFDIARVDSLFMLFVLASIYVVRFVGGTVGLVVSATLMFGAFLTKQTALLIAMPLSVAWLLIARRWGRIVYPATFGILVGLSTVLLDWVSEGWYRYYVFQLPGEHRVARSFLLYGFWVDDIAKRLTIATVVSVYFLVDRARRRESVVFWSALFAALVGSAWLSRIHSGGYSNVLLPGFAALAIYFGMGVGSLLNRYKGYATWILGVCILQFGLLFYPPLAQIPTYEDRAAGERLVGVIRSYGGDVLVPFHGYYGTLAGKRTYAHEQALGDVFRGKDGPLKVELEAEIAGALEKREFEAIILDRRWRYMDRIARGYEERGPVFESGGVFWPVTGWRIRPQVVYVRKGVEGLDSGEKK